MGPPLQCWGPGRRAVPINSYPPVVRLPVVTRAVPPSVSPRLVFPFWGLFSPPPPPSLPRRSPSSSTWWCSWSSCRGSGLVSAASYVYNRADRSHRGPHSGTIRCVHREMFTVILQGLSIVILLQWLNNSVDISVGVSGELQWADLGQIILSVVIVA